jgi:secondary thiamine-phosphate synthase enzyme
MGRRCFFPQRDATAASWPLQPEGRAAERLATVLFHQATIQLKPRPRGFHVVTREIIAAVPELARLRVGFLHLFLQHTSASLQINESADPDVRADFEHWCDRAIPDGAPYFIHTAEGDDDMPSHLKAGLFGISLTIPVSDGSLALGTWQGIYLGEHRDHAHTRSVVATLWGEERKT